MTTIATPPSATSSSKPVNPNARLRAWIAALQSDVPRVRTPILYRLMQLLVVLVMLVLPVVYIGLIGLLGYAVYLHTVNDVGMFQGIRSPRAMLFMFILYCVPIIGGVVTMFFMIKPFFAPRLEEHIPVTLTPEQQPKLFVLVENLCHAVKAPVPSEIVVDTQVNASASFRKGMLSFFGNDLTLTIGLPLVSCLSMNHFVGILAHEFGHFSQGAGMRLSYVISSINHWFARVVYERDQWDQTLVELGQASESGWIMLSVAFIRLMVWLSRRVLWILMLVGNIASCLLMRQMEYDADRHEASVSGSKGFEQTVYELHRINFGKQLAINHMRQFTGENQAPDNIPGLIAYHAQSLNKDTRKGIKDMVQNAAAGLFSTHPSDIRRIKSAKKTGFPGIFHFDQPASDLFADYDKLCRGVTMHTLHHSLGDQYNRLQLVKVDDLQKEHKQYQEGQSQSNAFLGNSDGTLLPLKFDGHVTDKLPDIKQALALQKQMAAKAQEYHDNPDTQKWSEQLTEVYGDLLQLRHFFIRKEYGIKDSHKTVNLTSNTKEAIIARRKKLLAARTHAIDALKPFNQLQSNRIFNALKILHHPALDKMKDVDAMRQNCKKQFRAYQAIMAIDDRILQLNELRIECIALLESIQIYKNDEAYVNKILSQSQDLTQMMRGIRTTLMTTEDPYATGNPEGNLGVSIVPRLTDPKDIGSTIEMADTVTEKSITCRSRLLSDLISYVLKVEKAAGIEQSNQR
jgi:Zn-dependent protease with chaperone function